MVKIPTDPPVPYRTFPGGCRKVQQRYPLSLISGHVPQGLTDLRQIPQVVMLGHQLTMKGLFVGLNRTHLHSVEVQTTASTFLRRKSSYKGFRAGVQNTANPF